MPRARIGLRATTLGVIACGVVVAVACTSRPQAISLGSDQAAMNAVAAIPSGDEGDLIRYGRNIITDTPKYASQYISARMSCAACHPQGGTVPHEGSLLGTYAKFPQWNKRAHRFIALQDRLAECFLYSMNGHPPSYYSREMIAMTAYIAWLSRGAKVGEGFKDQEPPHLHAAVAPSTARGAGVYRTRCIACHGVDGAGRGESIPPLWGARSFNDKAGMSRMDRIAPFVFAAMPQNKPGSLTPQEAVDVSAFVLSQPRPHFNKKKLVRFPAERSGFF